MKRPFESWVWLFVLAGIGSGTIWAAHEHITLFGWGAWGILGVISAFFCFYCFFYEWEHPLS